MNVLSVIQNGTNQVGKFIVANSPAILTGLGATGVVATAIYAVKGTIKAVEIIQNEDQIRQDKSITDVVKGDDEVEHIIEGVPYEPISTLEMAKLVWQCYIPTAALGLTSIACIIGANSISARRVAALASLYSLTETTLKEYQQAVVEQLGEKKEEKIHEAISEKRLREHPMDNCEIYMTGGGDTLFYESLSGRYFRGDFQKIRKAINDLNYEMQNRWNFISLNDWYREIGLEPTEMGRFMGWTANGLIDIDFNAKKTDDGQNACLAMYYKIQPHKE